MKKTQAEIELSIPSPCGAAWEQMGGQGAQRHCAACDKDVHHLSMMRREDAHALLSARAAGQRLCVRYFVAEDGAILFADDAPRPGAASARLHAQLAGAKKLLSAALVAAPLLLAACDQPEPHAPQAQSPLVIQEGQPVQLAPQRVEPGAAKPPAFNPSPAPPAPANEPVEYDGELRAPVELDGNVKVDAPAPEEEGCTGAAPPEEPAPLPKYKHKGVKPATSEGSKRVVMGDYGP